MVLGRTILTNGLLLRDLIELSDERGIPAALVCLDQLKAFDRVSWDFLFKTLLHFGLHPTFIKWVKIMYTDISSSVKVNGFTTEVFNLRRGVRQGCPLSPLLYILCAEVFALSIRADKEIKGIQINDKVHHKIRQYADDTALTVVGDDSIDSLFPHCHLLREHFISIRRFTANGAAALINDTELPITFVVIKSAPPELPDAAIIASLKCFGDVLSFRRAKHYDTDIENGNLTARMRLRTAIPSYIRIASESLYVYYNGQSHTCRRCNRSGHEARNCNNYACFNCDQLGHYATACTDALRCSICKSTGHKAHHCPFALIDALDKEVSITTSLVRTLEAIPFSLESESDNEDHGNLDNAATLERYLINTESTSHTTSPSSTASTVRSSVA